MAVLQYTEGGGLFQEIHSFTILLGRVRVPGGHRGTRMYICMCICRRNQAKVCHKQDLQVAPECMQQGPLDSPFSAPRSGQMTGSWGERGAAPGCGSHPATQQHSAPGFSCRCHRTRRQCLLHQSQWAKEEKAGSY